MKKYLALFIALSFVLMGCNSTKENQSLKESSTMNKNELKENNNKGASLDITNINKNNIPNLSLSEDNISISIDGIPISFSHPIYLEKNRYYIPLNEVVKTLNGTLIKENNTLTMSLNNESYVFDLDDNVVNSNIKLKKDLINNNNLYYISFSDLSNILNLYTRWDKDNKTIICKSNDSTFNNVEKYTPKISTVGYIRIEDVALSTQSYDKEFLEKLRIIGKFLDAKNIPYHIAWIPRYVCPSSNIDVDPMTLNDFSNAELVYTLDFLINNSGIIGLHGYTHQNGNEESAIGTEFGYNVPSTENFRQKIEKAISTAEYLDIPIEFFEAPHYEITAEQNKIAEEYFKILYYPFKDNGIENVNLTKPQLSPYNNSSYYISTPLDYIPENNIDGAINNLYNANTNNMGSIFFHPRLDFSFIELGEKNNIPTYEYKDNSPLKRVIDALQQKGFTISKVTDI